MTSARVLHAPVHRLLERAKSLAAIAVAEVKRWWRVLLAWHRHRLATDPLYPAAITTAGGALISVCVTSAHLAHLLRTALHLIAGHPAPLRPDLLTSDSALWGADSEYGEECYRSGGSYA